MHLAASADADVARRQIVMSRVFKAPRELVWNAMTDPSQVVHWWGPAGFTNTLEQMDFRVGGVWKHVMHGPDGTDYPNYSVFTEIVPLQRVVYRHGTSAADADWFVATWDLQTIDESTTRLVLSMTFDTVERRDRVVREYGAIEGGHQHMARLAAYLPPPTEQPFVISRVFAQPRETLWAVWTEAPHLKNWFGPKGMGMPAFNLDFRVDGGFHYCLATPDGKEMWGKWTFLEISPPSRLTLVNSFSDAAGGITRHPLAADWPLENLSTTTFVPQEGGTLLTIEWSPLRATAEETARFNASHDNMRQGWGGTFEQLDAYLATLDR